MSLSKLQKVVIRNSLKIARKLRFNNDLIYMQIPPTKHDFQVHVSAPSTVTDREILEAVHPAELHELIGKYPSRFLDGNMLRSFILSAARLERFRTSVASEITANEDLALDAYRRLSIQVLCFTLLNWERILIIISV